MQDSLRYQYSLLHVVRTVDRSYCRGGTTIFTYQKYIPLARVARYVAVQDLKNIFLAWLNKAFHGGDAYRENGERKIFKTAKTMRSSYNLASDVPTLKLETLNVTHYRSLVPSKHISSALRISFFLFKQNYCSQSLVSGDDLRLVLSRCLVTGVSPLIHIGILVSYHVCRQSFKKSIE